MLFLSSHTGGAGRVSSEAGRGEEQQAENQLSPGGGTRIPSYSACKMKMNIQKVKVMWPYINMSLPAAGTGEWAFAQSESILVWSPSQRFCSGGWTCAGKHRILLPKIPLIPRPAERCWVCLISHFTTIYWMIYALLFMPCFIKILDAILFLKCWIFVAAR